MTSIDVDSWLSHRDTSFEVEFKSFPGGEEHVNISRTSIFLPDISIVNIRARIRSAKELVRIGLVVDALRRMGTEKIHLSVPYFPGGRQDRVAVEGEALSADVYAKLIGGWVDKITILHPHSYVQPALLGPKCITEEPFCFWLRSIKRMTTKNEKVGIISPDAGATKKIQEFIADSYIHYLDLEERTFEFFQATKKRDPKTGKLSGFSFSGNNLPDTLFILDDICDGGGTFLGLLKEMNLPSNHKIHLSVTHGIFSNGVTPLCEAFDSVHTTDSFHLPGEEFPQSNLFFYPSL